VVSVRDSFKKSPLKLSKDRSFLNQSMILEDPIRISLKVPKDYGPRRNRNVFRTMQGKESINALEADHPEMPYMKINNTANN
jgi:hypothetical protein